MYKIKIIRFYIFLKAHNQHYESESLESSWNLTHALCTPLYTKLCRKNCILIGGEIDQWNVWHVKMLESIWSVLLTSTWNVEWWNHMLVSTNNKTLVLRCKTTKRQFRFVNIEMLRWTTGKLEASWAWNQTFSPGLSFHFSPFFCNHGRLDITFTLCWRNKRMKAFDDSDVK